MRSKYPDLFPVFRSTAQAEILGATLPYPERERTISQLSQLLGIPLATVSDEAARLVQAEILVGRRIGRANLLKPNAHNRLVQPLTEIVLATVGPHLLVHDSFAGIAGVQKLLIYGSWAARYLGSAGPPPNDLDLLVVGKPDRTAVYAAADMVEQRVGMPVNPVIISWTRWLDKDDPLIANIKANPTLEIDLSNEGGAGDVAGGSCGD